MIPRKEGKIHTDYTTCVLQSVKRAFWSGLLYILYHSPNVNQGQMYLFTISSKNGRFHLFREPFRLCKRCGMSGLSLPMINTDDKSLSSTSSHQHHHHHEHTPFPPTHNIRFIISFLLRFEEKDRMTSSMSREEEWRGEVESRRGGKREKRGGWE